MAERIVIIGAGMGGLLSALALAGAGREILLLDRDPPPPEGGPQEAFEQWEHRGVSHLRHSHAFLARFLNLIRARRPALLAELIAAGAREMSFAEMLPDPVRANYRPILGDSDLSILMTRRTTLEWVARRHVAALPGVTVRSHASVSGLTYSSARAPLTVIGVKGDVDGAPAVWPADIVIDASGRTSEVPAWLTEAGACVAETAEDAGILYYTRHYRLRPGQEEAPRSAGSGTGDLGYIKYGVFNADNGYFSITLAVPEIELGLRQAIVDPSVFDRICAAMPGPAAWIDPVRAEPQSRVFAMGDLQSRWRTLVAADGRPSVLGLFLVGDGLIRSNPLYGRGCTFAAVEAFALAEVLNESPDPASRARHYQAILQRELRPFYDNMLSQDRAAVRRARRAADPNHRPNLRSRVIKSLVDDGVSLTLRSDIAALRAALCAFHMLAPPDAWIRQPRHLARVLATWLAPRWTKRALYPKALGPRRADMMHALGLTV